MRKTITIAGGGLAGLTLGILLRRSEVPVEIWEGGRYPRQRVCGAFLSGKGLEILSGMGVPEFPTPMGTFAQTVRFYNSGRASGTLQLPQAALAVDRATLDHTLAQQFTAAGGVLRENSKWMEPFAREGLVRATGRRLNRNGKMRFVGLKVHAADLPLSADIELHFTEKGYVGLSRQQNGTVNVCGLFPAGGVWSGVRENSGEIFGSVVSGPAREKLEQVARASSADSLVAVAGISLKREFAKTSDECRVGDSICMIPPLTGNGMSLAIESAAIAAPTLEEFSRGGIDWVQARKRISQKCDEEFIRRLTFAGWIQSIAFTAPGRAVLMSILKTAPGVLNGWFRLTR